MVEDFNGPNPSGVGGYPVNVIDGVRQNTGIVYLTEEVRNRPNLKISAMSSSIVFCSPSDVRSASSRQVALRFMGAR